jgi:hypothetical protein
MVLDIATYAMHGAVFKRDILPPLVGRSEGGSRCTRKDAPREGEGQRAAIGIGVGDTIRPG